MASGGTISPIWQGAAEVRPKLLVVDDQPANIQVLYQILSPEYEVFMATSGQQAIDFCEKNQPDLILLDVVMPGMSGLEVCQTLKDSLETQHIPVIFVTSISDSASEQACWEAGGVDFIAKPVNPVTVRHRVRVHLTLKQQADTLRQMVFLDGLTGVANRRFFDERMDEEWRRHQRSGNALSLLMIDIDYFKRYNDTYGHQAGDDCLKRVATAIRRQMSRPHDLVARYGGEEFSCILPETSLEGARQVALHEVEAIRELAIPHRASEVSDVVTISVGAATMVPSSETTWADLISLADMQLYQAKKHGRNRVEIAPELAA